MDPETAEQWQEAVDLAHGWLSLDSARQYGLVTGGPEIEAERCVQILEAGKARGFTPSMDAVQRVLSLMAAYKGAE